MFAHVHVAYMFKEQVHVHVWVRLRLFVCGLLARGAHTMAPMPKSRLVTRRFADADTTYGAAGGSPGGKAGGGGGGDSKMITAGGVGGGGGVAGGAAGGGGQRGWGVMGLGGGWAGGAIGGASGGVKAPSHRSVGECRGSEPCFGLCAHTQHTHMRERGAS